MPLPRSRSLCQSRLRPQLQGIHPLTPAETILYSQFISIDPNTICFQVVRPIKAGEELTTYYADSYFGENNRDCLCETCEKFRMGGYSTAISEAVKEANSFRRSKARATKFNYYDVYPAVFEELVEMKKKYKKRSDSDDEELDEPENLLEECLTCHKTRHPSEHFSPNNECQRCDRHKKLFGRSWPERRSKFTRNGKGKVRRCRLFYHSLINQGGRSNMPGQVPKERNQIIAVFVDPQDDGKIWWPALVLSLIFTRALILLDYTPESVI